jgi:hypothetical protein
MTGDPSDADSGPPADESAVLDSALLEDDESTSRIPAAVVKSLLAGEDATTKIPAHFVASLIAKAKADANTAAGVVRPPRTPSVRAPSSVSHEPLADDVRSIAESVSEIVGEAPPTPSQPETSADAIDVVFDETSEHLRNAARNVLPDYEEIRDQLREAADRTPKPGR